MKQYLSAAALVLALAGTAQATSVEFFLSDDMAATGRTVYGENTVPGFNILDAFTFTALMQLDTDKIEQHALSFSSAHQDDAVEVMSFTVGKNIHVESYTGRFAFGDDWAIEDWNFEAIAFGPDGQQFRISSDTFESWSEVTPVNGDGFYDSYVGSNASWNVTPVDAPAPVPLPAAGFLLLGGLAALGIACSRGRRASV